MRFISYRTLICAILALAGLSVSACSDLSRQTQLGNGPQTQKILINQQDSDISNRLARVWMRVARQAMANGDPATAARFFRKASDSAPESARPLLGLARAHDRQGKVELAADAFRSALKIDPENRTARVSLGNLLVAHGKIDEGMGYLMPASAAKRPSSPASRTPASQRSDNIFSLISGLFQPDEASGAAAQPSPPPTVKKPEASRKLMVPAAAPGKVFRPPMTHIGHTLKKIEPAATPKKADSRPESRQPARPEATPDAASAAHALKLAMVSASEEAPAHAAARQPAKIPAAMAPAEMMPAETAPAPKSPAAAATPRYTVQLAAYRHLENANRGQRILSRMLPGHFPGLKVFIRQGRGNDAFRANYRLRAPQTISRSDANELCRKAEAAGQACLVIRQTSANWRLVNATTRSHTSKIASPTHTAPKARPARTEKTTAGTGPQFRIQLAAYRHLRNAIKGKQVLARLLPDGFPGLAILKRDGRLAGATPINFRIRSSSPWPETRARKFCDRARATGIACLLIQHRAKSWQLVAADGPASASVQGTKAGPAKPLNRTHLIATR